MIFGERHEPAHEKSFVVKVKKSCCASLSGDDPQLLIDTWRSGITTDDTLTISAKTDEFMTIG
jgi:hypothetical protein